MIVKTDYVGDVEYAEDEVIKFPNGIFGFEDQKEFIIVGELTPDFPFIWLQSIKDPYVVFVLTDPFLFVKDYDFKLSEEIVHTLGTGDVNDVKVFSIVVIPMDSKKTTINLRSPVVINADKRIGEQAILDEDYPYKYFVFNKE